MRFTLLIILWLIDHVLVARLSAQQPDISQLLKAAKRTGQLTASPETKSSYTGLDVSYEKSLIRLNYCQEALQRFNPQYVKLDQLNRVCMSMAQNGQHDLAKELVSQFENSPSIQRQLSSLGINFETAMKPGFTAGKLLNSLQTGDLEQANQLAKQITGFMKNGEHFYFDLYRVMVIYSLKHNQFELAAQLLLQNEHLNLENETTKRRRLFGRIASHVRYRDHFKSEKLLSFLSVLASHDKSFAIELAGAYLYSLGRFPKNKFAGDVVPYLNFIRETEKEVGHLVDVEGRCGVLRSNFLDQAGRDLVLQEIDSITKQPHVVMSSPISIIFADTMTILGRYDITVNYNNRIQPYSGVGQNLSRLLKLGKKEEASNLILNLKPPESTLGKSWHGIRALECDQTELAKQMLDEIPERKQQTSKRKNWHHEELKLNLLIHETEYSDPQPVITCLEEIADEYESLDLYSLGRHIGSKRFIESVAIKGSARVADNIVAALSDEYFSKSNPTGSNSMRIAILGCLFQAGKTEEAIEYARYLGKLKIPRLSFGRLLTYNVFKNPNFNESVLDELRKCFLSSKSFTAFETRYFSFHKEKAKATKALRRLFELEKRSGQPRPIRFALNDYESKNIDQIFTPEQLSDLPFDLRRDLIEWAAAQDDVDTVLKLVGPIQDARRKCGLYLTVAKEMLERKIENTFKFPMHDQTLKN